MAEFLNVWSAGGDAFLNLTIAMEAVSTWPSTWALVIQALLSLLLPPLFACSATVVPPTRRRADRQAAVDAGLQESLERAISPLLANPPTASPAQPTSPPSPSPAATTAPVTIPSFASVTARPAAVFKCDRCTAAFKDECSLKTHLHSHKPSPSMRLYKTMYYQ